MGKNVPKIATVIGTAFAVGVTVMSGTQAGAVSAGRLAAAEATVLTMAVSTHRVQPGDGFDVMAELVLQSDASGVTGQTVRLQWQTLGAAGWRDGGTAVTEGTGAATWQVDRLPESRRYRVVFEGTASHGASKSEVAKVRMQPVLTASASRDWVRPDGTVTVTAKVRPALGGEALILQRRVGGGWLDVKSKGSDADGRASFSVGGRAAYGLQRYRVALSKRQDHLGARSASIRIRTVRLVTYVIETRGKVQGALPSFRRRSAEIFADPRGWSRTNVHFKRVTSGGAFSLVLSQAKYVPGFAPICDRYWSCQVGRYVVVNENRWRQGTPYFMSEGGTLRQYRAMVVNHEAGHWFGLGHASCGGRGRPAPVMMQQSKGLHGCKPNAWPRDWEVGLAY